MKPHPRNGMTLTALRGRLVLFGGKGSTADCFDDLQILDPLLRKSTPDSASSSLKQQGGMNPGYSWCRVASRSDGLGGEKRNVASSKDGETVPTVFICGRGPGRRTRHSATAVDGKMYIFGGSDGTFYNSLHRCVVSCNASSNCKLFLVGSKYRNDLYVLDTAPLPEAMVS